MHAVVANQSGGPEVLEWQSWPMLAPRSGEVSLRIRLAGVNWADLAARRAVKAPQILGLDACGEIMFLGQDVTGWHEGQRVAAFTPRGSYAEATVVPVEQVFALADDLPDELGASLVTLVTAYNIIHWAARVQPGEVVVVHAASGGVGSIAVQLARKLGARVLGVVGSAERAAWVESLGAEAIQRHAADWSEIVQEKTDGNGPDVILDSVSGETLERGLQILAPFGRLVTCGQAGGRAARIDTSLLHRHNRAVIGYSSGHYRAQRPAALRSTVERVFELYRDGDFQLPPSQVFALCDAAQAHLWLEEEQGMGKAFLRP